MQKITVVYNVRLCCICTTNSSQFYLNIHQNVICFKNIYFPLSQIIEETLSFKLSRDDQHICINCKSRIVEFFTFKRINEEARKLFSKVSTIHVVSSQKDILVTDQTSTDLSTDKYETEDNNEYELHENDKIESSSSERKLKKSYKETWIRSKRKIAKNTGKSYISSKGKFVDAKEMRKSCNSCRLNCSEKISETDRIRNFECFYKLGDIGKQRSFLYSHMKIFSPKRSPNEKVQHPQKSRKIQRNFYLEKFNVNGSSELIKVCRFMFLNTFCISSQMLDTIYRKFAYNGIIDDDQRGKYERHKIRQKESKINCDED